MQTKRFSHSAIDTIEGLPVTFSNFKFSISHSQFHILKISHSQISDSQISHSQISHSQISHSQISHSQISHSQISYSQKDYIEHFQTRF
jgi:hypothetical protein